MPIHQIILSKSKGIFAKKKKNLKTDTLVVTHTITYVKGELSMIRKYISHILRNKNKVHFQIPYIIAGHIQSINSLWPSDAI